VSVVANIVDSDTEVGI